MTAAEAGLGLVALRAEVDGEVVGPSDANYGAHRAVWNADFDRYPALIVLATGAQDVLAALKYARAHGLQVTVRGGGHSFSGLSVADGALLIDLRRMNRVVVDPVRRRARVQGGAIWAEVDRAAQAHGLAVTGGQVSHTGVAGLTLGGGLGYLMRKQGLTIDHLVSADVVTADGRIVRASADEHPDLFFALRGGGGNFGVVTEFEFRLHPLDPIVLGGHLGWSRDQGPEFLRRYANFLRSCPDELMTTLIYLEMPPLPFIPPALRRKPGWLLSICGTNIPGAEAALAPLRECGPSFDVVQPMPYLAVQSFLDKAEPFGTRLYGNGHHFDVVTEELLLTLHDQFADLPTRDSKVFGLQMGGAVARVHDDDMAFTGRRAGMSMMFEAEWKRPDQREACVSWVRRVCAATQAFAIGAYHNFGRQFDEDALRTIYGEEKYLRLQTIKARYDPENVFRHNHNIRPALPMHAGGEQRSKDAAHPVQGSVSRLVIAAYDVEESAAFYREIFGFQDLGASTRRLGSRSLEHATIGQAGGPEFDLVECRDHWRLPTTYHFALETDGPTFEAIYATLKRRGAKVLSDPPPQVDNGGFGTYVARGVRYRRFFFVDPTIVYLEVLHRLQEPGDEAPPPVPTPLRINHLIITARDVPTSVEFYASILGLKDIGDNPHEKGARTLVWDDADGRELLSLIIHPYADWLLPNPTHVSLTVDERTFARIRAYAATSREPIIEGSSPAVSAEPVDTDFDSARRICLVDPSGVRVEILTTYDAPP